MVVSEASSNVQCIKWAYTAITSFPIFTLKKEILFTKIEKRHIELNKEKKDGEEVLHFYEIDGFTTRNFIALLEHFSKWI